MAKQTAIAVPIIIFALMAFFILYIILIPPSGRVKIFGTKEQLGANTIQIKDKMFIPEELTIKKGVTVTWINEDSANNKISGSNFESGILHHNEKYSHKFSETGVYVYTSEFYPEFTGKIIVK